MSNSFAFLNKPLDKKTIGILSMILIILLTILLAFAMNNQNTDSRRDASPIKSVADNTIATQEYSLNELTQSVVEMANMYDKVEKAQRSDLYNSILSTIKQRREIINMNPKELALNTIPSEVSSKFPVTARNMVEQKINIGGEFEWLHSDNFDANTSEEMYYVTDEKTKKKYKLYFVEEKLPKAKSGDKVSIDVYTLDDNAVVMNEDDFEVTNVVEYTPTTTKKILTLLVNFTGTATQPWTIDAVRNTVFTGTTSSNEFYKENSFGQWQLSGKVRPDGDIYGWFTIPFNGSTCDYSLIGSQARSAAQAAGIDITGYDNYLYAFPRISACSWSGLAGLGSYPGYLYINGAMSSSIVAHELGHNYLMHHASSYNCIENGVRVSISEELNCTIGEYGDPFDNMGSSYFHYSNYHKGLTGNNSATAPKWLKSTNTLTLNPSTNPDGVYAVTPIETESAGIQSLRIPRDVSNGVVTSYYYVEFRQPYGFDSFQATNPVVNGVTIRLASDYTSIARSRLIDTVASTTTFSDAPLTVGKAFNDPYKNITITTESVSATGANVRVTFGTVPCVNSAPNLSITPTSASSGPGGSLTYRYTLTNADPALCTSSTYNLGVTLPSGWSMIPTSLQNETLSPGQSITRDLTIVSPNTSTAGNYNFTLRATSTLNQTLAKTATATYVVSSADTVKPIARILNPSNGTVLPSKGNLSIQTSASDNVKVTLIQILVDNKVVASCRSKNICNSNYNVSKLSAGNHTIGVKAYDAAGNVSDPVSVSVTK